MVRVINVILLFMTIVFVSCRPHKARTPKSYVTILETEGTFSKTVHTKNVDYTIQLAPPEYMVCQELGTSISKADSGIAQQRLRELKGTIFFLIKIKPNENISVAKELENKGHADQRAMYYQSNASADIRLLMGDIEQLPLTYHFEDNYGLAPYNTIIVGFNWIDTISDMQLVFNDRYYQNPLIKAYYGASDISTNLPTLMTN